MRLIDADALVKELMHEGLGYQYNRVINAPTVEAIPIEWLKNWNPKELNDTGYQVMRRIIDDWEKRNETD